MAFSLSSTAFIHNGEIPAKYTCEGEDISPPLNWTGAPAGTESLALIVEDPDAPDPAAPRMTWIHWILYNISKDLTGLPESVASETLPNGAREALNDWDRPGYGGPCPPIGRHRYFFRLFALDTALPDLGFAKKPAVEQAMTAHVLGTAELIGTYKKQ